jgi:predicted N-acetyltransferase YhbS
MLALAPEQPADAAAVETLLDTVFGPDRHAKRSYAYRRGVAPVAELCVVARAAGRIVGAIRYWPVTVGGTPALLLGPLAVDPARRGTGIGATLVDHTLERADAAGWRVVLLVGEPAYYRRFGFHPATPHGLVMPGELPHRLMVRALRPGALADVAGDVEPWATGSRPATTRPARAGA